MGNVVAIGDNCIDIYTNRQVQFPGGGCVNFAVHARRAGAEVAYVGLIGDDQQGDWLRDALIAEQVDIGGLCRMPGKTAVAYVELQGHERNFLGKDRGVREQLVIDTPLQDFIHAFDHIHTTLDGCVDQHIPSWHAAGKTISYDFSHRAKPEQIALLPYVSIAFFSGQRMTLDQAATTAHDSAQVSQGIVVVTLGKRGSLACVGGDLFHQPALPVTLVDTLGAGDAFQAAFVVQYLVSQDPKVALLNGARRAAAACEQYGGFGYPHSGE